MTKSKSGIKNKVVKKFTGRDVASNFKKGMRWESEHFGYCTMNCYYGHRLSGHLSLRRRLEIHLCGYYGTDCPAIFHYDGGLRFICANRYCTHPQRFYSIPALIFNEIAEARNKANKIKTALV